MSDHSQQKTFVRKSVLISDYLCCTALVLEALPSKKTSAHIYSTFLFAVYQLVYSELE